MPRSQVSFYQELDGSCPVSTWLAELRSNNPRAYAKCVVRIQRLAELGHELRRPEADFLRDGIYELRARLGTVNYRLLYFFHGRAVAIVAHGLTKEGGVPAVEINRAVARRRAFVQNPKAHTYEG
jgi:hypothetical protein